MCKFVVKLSNIILLFIILDYLKYNRVKKIDVLNL